MRDLEDSLREAMQLEAVHAPKGIGLASAVTVRYRRHVVRRRVLGGGVLIAGLGLLGMLIPIPSVTAPTPDSLSFGAVVEGTQRCSAPLTDGPQAQALAKETSSLLDTGWIVRTQQEFEPCFENHKRADGHTRTDTHVSVGRHTERSNTYARVGRKTERSIELLDISRSRFVPAYTRLEIIEGAQRPTGSGPLSTERVIPGGQVLLFDNTRSRTVVAFLTNGRTVRIRHVYGEDSSKSLTDAEQLIRLSAALLTT